MALNMLPDTLTLVSGIISGTGLKTMISDIDHSGHFILTCEIVSTTIGRSPNSNVICELLLLYLSQTKS